MITDPLLEEVEKKAEKKTVWGNYTHTYDWTWTDRPVLIPINKEMTASVLLRDWTVAEKLKSLGVKRVLDVGSDTGHFIAVLKYHGIEAVGVDTEKASCEKIIAKGQNHCYNLGIEDLIGLDVTTYDCITCMNITHAKWEDESLKQNFILWIEKHFKNAVLSDFTHQDKGWKNFTKIHDFNVLPVYCSPFIVKIARKLGFEKIVSYLCIQKIYKIK